MYFVEIEVYCIISQTYAALSVFRTYITHGASFRCRGWDGCWGLGRLCRKGVLLFFRCPVRPFLFDQVRLTSMTLCLCFLSGLWLVDPVLSKAKLVQVLINVAPMNLQKLSTKSRHCVDHSADTGYTLLCMQIDNASHCFSFPGATTGNYELEQDDIRMYIGN